jgi:hypothetical protein
VVTGLAPDVQEHPFLRERAARGRKAVSHDARQRAALSS